MKKVLFLVPDGVGIRNYLYSDIIKHLKPKSEIWIWSPLPSEAFEDVKELHNIKFNYKYLELHTEGFFTRITRESSTYARLLVNAKKTENPSILTNWNYTPKTLKHKAVNFVAQRIGKWASKKNIRILRLEAKAKANWNDAIVEMYIQQLVALQPDKIFITHQRVAALMPICIAAQKLGIEVISVIYSWDNLPKARLAVEADKYLVWSKYMKEEMQLYYPEIDGSKVIVAGTPQFEFYAQENRIESREFFAKNNHLNPNKKWICFSGDDEKTSPYDPIYLEDIAKSVSEMNEQDRPLIIFRRCPVDYSNRYDKVLNKFKEVIVAIDPLWNTPKAGQNWGAVFPKEEDVTAQVNLAFHCELVINLGSTMAHDFAVYNKPCLYLNYNPVISNHWSVETVYSFQHFRSMKGLDAVGWINSSEEIKSKLKQILEGKLNIAPDKLKWMQIINREPINKCSQLIANEINS